MLSSIAREEELAYVLPVLMAEAHMEKGKNAGIVDVRLLSPSTANEMSKLGYTELTPDLLAAFVKIGDIRPLEKEDLRLFDGDLMRKLIGE